MLVILRYHDEFRKPESYFDNIKADAKSDAVKLAVNLIKDPWVNSNRRGCARSTATSS